MKKTLIAVLSLAAAFNDFAFATLLLSDDFPTNGALVGTTPAIGGNWTNSSGTAGTLLVANNSLEINTSRTEDATSLFGGNQTVNLYAGFILNMSSSLPSAAGTYFASFMSGPTGTTYAGRLFALVPAGTTAGSFRLGLSGSSATSTNNSTFELTPNTSYQVVMKFTQDASNDVVTLWVDPTDENSSSLSTAPAAVATSLTGFGFRQASGSGNLTIDTLRVGTTFAEVVPEPSTWALIGLGSAFVLWRIRRKVATRA
jgi:hypothetical protein